MGIFPFIVISIYYYFYILVIYLIINKITFTPFRWGGLIKHSQVPILNFWPLLPLLLWLSPRPPFLIHSHHWTLSLAFFLEQSYRPNSEDSILRLYSSHPIVVSQRLIADGSSFSGNYASQLDVSSELGCYIFTKSVFRSLFEFFKSRLHIRSNVTLTAGGGDVIFIFFFIFKKYNTLLILIWTLQIFSN